MQLSSLDQLRLYLNRQATNLDRYILERSLFALLGWTPTVDHFKEAELSGEELR